MITSEYLAGLIDGEGYLGILPVRSTDITNLCFEPVIKIGMTGTPSRLVLEEVSAQWGGTIGKRSGLTKGGREAFLYALRSKRKVLALLDELIPHLRVKHSQALLLKEFCELPYAHPKSPVFDRSIVNRRIALYHELKAQKLPEPLAETN